MQGQRGTESTAIFEMRITQILQLRTLVVGIGRIGEALRTAGSPLFKSIGEVSPHPSELMQMLRDGGIFELDRYIEGEHLYDGQC
jgi:hypothetical protein